MRGGSNTVDIQVNLLHKEERTIQSYAIARDMRTDVQKIAKKIWCQCKAYRSSARTTSFINISC
jgi:hypothetical protein